VSEEGSTILDPDDILICRGQCPGQVGRRKSVTSWSFSNPADTYAATPPTVLLGVHTLALDDPNR
jgi:hypothetical protein